MHAARRVVLVIAIMTASAARAIAQPGVKADPDWPCQQIKTPTLSLASVWAGPELDLNSQSWRNESDIADLATKMTQRRIPIADVESAIADFKAKAGPDADAKVLSSFAAAFEDLSQQRSQIIDGLVRLAASSALWPSVSARRTRRFKNLRTRAVMATRRPAATVKSGCNGTSVFSTNAVRPSVMSARRRLLIEQRIGEIARSVQKAL